MADLRDKVNVEMENISAVLAESEKIKDKPNKPIVELAGIGTVFKGEINALLSEEGYT